jgi:LacI family transcriptional regulator
MKRATIKDIAKELNISVGTVSKALSEKNGVSNEMREKINYTAKKMGYHVNRVAQSLSRKQLKIGIVMPSLWPEYYGCLKKGIDKFLSNMADYNITAQYRFVSSLYSSTEYIDVLDSFIQQKMNGVIICPAFISDYSDHINVLSEKNIPVVILGSDLPSGNRITCVREDSCLAGKLAAEIMKWIVGENETVAVFIGNKDMSDHREKVNGFLGEFCSNTAGIVNIYETQDDPEVAYILTKKVIKDNPVIGGIYVATGNSISVCKALEDNNCVDRVSIIATDIFPELAEYVKKGVIRGLIFQDPVKQGKIAIESLYRYLVFRDPCDNEILIRPQLIIRNNFDVYYSMMNDEHDTKGILCSESED